MDNSRSDALLPGYGSDLDLRLQSLIGCFRKFTGLLSILQNPAADHKCIHCFLGEIGIGISLCILQAIPFGTILSVAEHKLASEINESISVRVIIAIAVFGATALASRLIIRVIVDITRSPVVTKSLIEFVSSSRVSLVFIRAKD